MRAFLAIVVAVIQVAGPSLCCCGPTQLLARAFPRIQQLAEVSEQFPATPKSAESECPICARRAAKSLESTAVARAKPTPPAPLAPAVPEPCPCGGYVLEIAPPANLDRDASQLVEFATTLAIEPLSVPEPTAIPREAPQPAGLSELRFLPPGERTRVHHVLHC